MAEVTETQLPGVGVRYEFTTESGQQVGVISHRGGRREIVVYHPDDPDVCSTVMDLSPGDTRAMAELLGATRVSEVLSAVQHEIEGLSIDWLRVPPGSSFVGRTIADGMFRSRTGVSIVAVLRHAETFPAPDPTFRFDADDVAVSVGTPPGLDEVRAMFAS